MDSWQGSPEVWPDPVKCMYTVLKLRITFPIKKFLCFSLEKCLKKLFQIIFRTVTAFERNTQPHVSKITLTCLQFQQSSYCSSAIKEVALDIIAHLMKNRKISSSDARTVINDLMLTFTSVQDKGQLRTGKLKLKILGYASRSYANEMRDHARNLRIELLRTIQIKTANDSSSNLNIAAAAVSALGDHIHSFPFNEDDLQERHLMDGLYTTLKTLSVRMRGEKEVSRNALQFMEEHFDLFKERIYEEHRSWLSTFMDWVDDYDAADRRLAIETVNKFYRMISREIEAKNDEQSKVMLESFINDFRTTLKNSKSSFYRVRVAIRGFGTLSKSCKTVLPQQVLNDLMSLVLQRIKMADYGDDNAKQRKFLEHLPDYIQALGNIMANMDELSQVQFDHLTTIIVQLIKDFFYLDQTQHYSVIISLLATFEIMEKLNGNPLDDMLEKVVLQGVVWTCDTKLEIEVDWEKDWKENVTYRKYLPLWTGLVRCQLHTDVNRPKMAGKVLNALINTLLHILNRLNLTTTKRIHQDDNGEDQELYFCDPNFDLMPLKAVDFKIFFNVVDLYVDIFSSLALELQSNVFGKWLKRFSHEMIQKIQQNPFVSGFSKLLGVALKISKQIKYPFSDHSDFNALLGSFLKEILQRTEIVTAELQITQLQLIYRFPVTILLDFVDKVIPVLLLGFGIGRNLIWLWLANMALECLEDLIAECVNEDDRKQLLESILPSLDWFLRSQGEDDQREAVQTKVIRKNDRKGKYTIQRKFNFTMEENDLIKFQRRILVFLGKFVDKFILLAFL